MKIGVIFCAFNTIDLLDRSLSPWATARSNRLGCNDFVVVGVSCPFEGFPNDREDGTTAAMKGELAAGHIDHLITSETPIKETEARGRALHWLISQGAELIVQADSDEMFTSTDIFRLLKFIEVHPMVGWFRFSFKNAVFNDKTFLKEPFTPPRAHRVRIGGYRAHSFWDDNNVLYGGMITRDLIKDVEFSCKTIPPSVALIPHETWLNNSRSKSKILYQQGRSWNCSFVWDDAQGGLIWNPTLPIPEIVREE